MSSITVLLADDHAAIRLGMRMVLETQPGLRVVGEAADGVQAIRMARALRPDVVLMDLRMPVVDGIQATREIIAEALSRVLVLTTFDQDSYLFGALEAGADGFLLKSAEPAEITVALQRVHAGDSVISPEVTARIVSAAVSGRAASSLDGAATPEAVASVQLLTGREREVLDCLGEGLSNQLIGRRLGISETTVKTHVSRVLAKLGFQSRVQAALFSRRR
ncbi:response regulator [Arthrobacter rhombi]|uniref:DNA-binding response regulator, LuxR family n=1 Tax=Arthrobacter rhombi TaxID=71253 RepID=A0A1R4G0U5_9MICC|nr:response regulator transcription factor [Arthrobacter rhombi]SJM61602.1 DNA-binding response regulator, LuxR family [Arthrobacter rhombi]